MIRRIRGLCIGVALAAVLCGLGSMAYYVLRELATDVFVLAAGAR